MHNLLERVAQELWSRFAPEHHIEWEDEQGKAEYRLAAKAVLDLASHTPAPQPAAHRRVHDAAPARPEMDALIAEAKKAALEEAAKVFDVYASDQRASIAEGRVTGIGVNNAEVRAETWEEAVWQLRNAADKPAILALIEHATPKSKEAPE